MGTKKKDDISKIGVCTIECGGIFHGRPLIKGGYTHDWAELICSYIL